MAAMKHKLKSVTAMQGRVDDITDPAERAAECFHRITGKSKEKVLSEGTDEEKGYLLFLGKYYCKLPFDDLLLEPEEEDELNHTYSRQRMVLEMLQEVWTPLVERESTEARRIAALLARFVIEFHLLKQNPTIDDLPTIRALEKPILIHREALLKQLTLIREVEVATVFFMEREKTNSWGMPFALRDIFHGHSTGTFYKELHIPSMYFEALPTLYQDTPSEDIKFFPRYTRIQPQSDSINVREYVYSLEEKVKDYTLGRYLMCYDEIDPFIGEYK